ncbi:MAG: hypothetical protein ABFD98_03240 [Syntrophobacteraceae bacterium]|nr:hypothetical protein [Desulfobacteraceae bacterium]
MQIEQPTAPGLLDLVRKTLGAPLGPGQAGVMMSRAGIGKTACLTHVALDHLLRGHTVAHACIGDIPEKVKVWYHELLKGVFPSPSGTEAAREHHRIEPQRFIMSFLQQTFQPAKLEQNLQSLREQTRFRPSMLIVDGLDFDRVERPTMEALKDIALRNEACLWMSARTHRHISTVNEHGVPYPCNEIDDLFDAILLLDAVPEAIQVKALKKDGQYVSRGPEALLHPDTYLLIER